MLNGNVGCGKTHPVTAHGRTFLRPGILVRFFLVSSPVMTPKESQTEPVGMSPVIATEPGTILNHCRPLVKTRPLSSNRDLGSNRCSGVFHDGDKTWAFLNRIIHHDESVRFQGKSHHAAHPFMDNCQHNPGNANSCSKSGVLCPDTVTIHTIDIVIFISRTDQPSGSLLVSIAPLPKLRYSCTAPMTQSFLTVHQHPAVA